MFREVKDIDYDYIKRQVTVNWETTLENPLIRSGDTDDEQDEGKLLL